MRNATKTSAIFDLLCAFGGLERLAEVKMPRNKRGDPKGYTEDQKAFLETWKGFPVSPLVTVDDARLFALRLREDARILKGARG